MPRDLKVNIVRLKRKEGAMHPEKQTIIENLTKQGYKAKGRRAVPYRSAKMRTFGFFRGVGHSEAKIRTRDRFDLMMDHEPGKQRFVSFFSY